MLRVSTAKIDKEPSGNKYSMTAYSSRMNRVIPVTVEAMAFEAYRGQLGVGHSDAARIRAAIQFRPHAQPGPAMGGSDQAHDGGEVDERRAAPVHRDVRKQSMLDLVPLTRAGWKVTHRDSETRAIGELLQFPLPQAQAGAVAPTRIRRDQHGVGLAIGRTAHLLPPRSEERRVGKECRSGGVAESCTRTMA